MADSDGIFTLESAAKRGPGNYVRIRASQLNARAIGRVFNLFPESVFLVAGDGSVELPGDDGCFQTDTMDSSLVWTCDGDSSKPVHQGSQWQQQGESQPGPSGFQYAYQPADETRQRERFQRQQRSGSKSAGKWKPKFSTSTLRGRPSMEVRSHQPMPTLAWTKTVEICALEGSQLKKSFNLPLSLTESSATVVCVADFVSNEAFDGAAAVLLDAENLLIPDSVGTRGSYYMY